MFFWTGRSRTPAKKAPLPGSVVAIFKDITRFRRQAQKAQERQHHLMEALVRAVEYVDPNLVGHTRKMRHVAELLARHMELDNTAVLTLRMASQLSQIGKIFVPHHLHAQKRQAHARGAAGRTAVFGVCLPRPVRDQLRPACSRSPCTT